MSATLRDRGVRPGPAGGGVPARRAVARWAWRLFRREWRQQILVLALLTLTVAAAAFSVSAAYDVASLPGPQFGSANHLLQFDGTNPRALTADIAAARKAFGTIQVIGRRFVPIPGSTQTVEFRAESPHGPYSGPMLTLTKGRFPGGPGQVALTGPLAQTLQLRIGSALSLDGHQTVTGIVENPSDLNDQFALVSPSGAGPPQSATVLLNAGPASFDAFRAAFHGPLVWQARGASTQGAVAGGMLGAVTVLLLLVGLVAAAGFAVIAARRQRQLGMLAAIGATRKQLRMVMVTGGAVVGVIAAVAGTAAGLAVWIAAAPGLDTLAGHRIDRFAIPWDLVTLGMLLAVVTATGAAWWPARAAARLPVTLALSARPPRPRPAHRPALLAAVMIVVGVACLGLGNQNRPPLIIAGAVAMTLGILLISPLAIRALATPGRRAPVAVRLALRDLARHQARSGAALAAISLALGITAAIIISSAADKTAANAGNLPDTQILVWTGQPDGPNGPVIPLRTPAQLRVLAAAVHQIAGSLPHSEVTALDMPVNPADKPQPGGQGSQAAAGSQHGRPAEPSRRRPGRDLQHDPPLCRHASSTPLPRDQPGHDHPSRRFPHRRGGAARGHHTLHLCDRHPRAADPGPLLHLPAHLADDPGRPAPARLDTDTVGLARPVRQASYRRAARSRTGRGRESRPDHRGQEQPGLTNHDQRRSDGRRGTARPGRPRHDRRADPHRGRR
ncbi:MAG: FtsX-like permease family protein [Streptosporangiales bacterium]